MKFIFTFLSSKFIFVLNSKTPFAKNETRGLIVILSLSLYNKIFVSFKFSPYIFKSSEKPLSLISKPFLLLFILNVVSN